MRPIYSVILSVNGIDLAAFTLLPALSMLKISILFWLTTHAIPALSGLAVLAFGEILQQFVDIFILIVVLFSWMSWFNPTTSAALVEIIMKISDPFLRPARGLGLSISGIDFSPMAVVMIMFLVRILIVDPVIQIGFNIMHMSLVS